MSFLALGLGFGIERVSFQLVTNRIRFRTEDIVRLLTGTQSRHNNVVVVKHDHVTTLLQHIVSVISTSGWIGML